MNHSISSYEERLSGASLINFEHLCTHPEDIMYIVEKYYTDMNFRTAIINNLRNNLAFKRNFYRIFGNLKPNKANGKGR